MAAAPSWLLLHVLCHQRDRSLWGRGPRFMPWVSRTYEPNLCRLGKSTPNAAWFYKSSMRGSRDFPSASFSFFPKPSFPGESPGLAFISDRARFGERLLSILIKLHLPLCAETLLRSLQRCHPKITQ